MIFSSFTHRSLQQLQQVDLNESLIKEREDAIDDITTSMVEVSTVNMAAV